MTYYRLSQPRDCQTEEEEVRRNGWGGGAAGLPGVDCSVCGDKRGLPGRLLPWKLPPDLAQELRALDFHPIPEDEHKSLRQRVEAGLKALNPEATAMPPGASFPPLFHNFVEPPRVDVYWSGEPDLTVSARLASALREIEATGFDLVPVDRVRVGVRMPRFDDLEAWRTGGGTEGEEGPELFCISIRRNDLLSSRMHRLPPCPGCGYSVVDRGYRWERWEDRMWNGHDIFFFPTTSHIVVTDRVARLLQDMEIGNIVLTRLRPGKDAFRPLYLDFARGLGRIFRWVAWRRSGLTK